MAGERKLRWGSLELDEEEDDLAEVDFWWAGAGVGVRDRFDDEEEGDADGSSLKCLDMLNKAAAKVLQEKQVK